MLHPKHLWAKKDPPRTETTPENRTGCWTEQAQSKHSHMSADTCERNKGLDKSLIIDTNYQFDLKVKTDIVAAVRMF